MAAVDYGEPGTDYHTERYAYNHRGQLTFTDDTCGGKRAAEYDAFGNLTATVSPNQKKTLYGHDADGNITSRTNALGIREYLLSYDALGNVASYTDGNGNVTEYMRSPSGDVEKVTGPDGKLTGVSHMTSGADSGASRTETAARPCIQGTGRGA